MSGRPPIHIPNEVGDATRSGNRFRVKLTSVQLPTGRVFRSERGSKSLGARTVTSSMIMAALWLAQTRSISTKRLAEGFVYGACDVSTSIFWNGDQSSKVLKFLRLAGRMGSFAA